MTVVTWNPSANSFRDLLSLPSRLRYLAWVLLRRRWTITLQFRDRLRFRLRPHSKLATDHGVVYEIFVHDMYRPALKLGQAEVRHIVDLGGNAGFSVLRFLSWFPNAQVLAMEPYPQHAQALRENVALNGWSQRVDLKQAAAGPSPGRATLSDQGASSQLGAEQGIDVELLDVFPLLLGRRIDILKIDIEGAEHPILDDPRFDRVDARCVLLEWHKTRAIPDARTRCCAKLVGLGYAVEEAFVEESAGMIYGLKV